MARVFITNALNELLDNEVIVKVATKKFKLEGKDYDYGTILIPVQNNNHIDLNELLNDISSNCNIEINPLKLDMLKVLILVVIISEGYIKKMLQC